MAQIEYDKNEQNIYGNHPTGSVYSPIDLDFDPMESLALLNFEGNSEYEGLELQLFDDELKGRGAAAIMWRCDKKGDFKFHLV
jgi:hypothetical protein